MRKILTGTILIGLLLGFALKMLEDNLPQFFASQYKLVFKVGRMNVGYNDLTQAALWGLLAIAVGPLGLAALGGLVIHQVLWYFGGIDKMKPFGLSL